MDSSCTNLLGDARKWMHPRANTVGLASIFSDEEGTKLAVGTVLLDGEGAFVLERRDERTETNIPRFRARKRRF